MLSAGACNQLIIAPSVVGARVVPALARQPWAAEGCRGCSHQQEEQEESDRSRRCRKEERGVSTHRAGPPPPAFIFNQLRRQSPAILERSRARSSGICRRGLLRHVTVLLATARANLNPPTTHARHHPCRRRQARATPVASVATHPFGQRPLHEVAAVASSAPAASASPRRLSGLQCGYRQRNVCSSVSLLRGSGRLISRPSAKEWRRGTLDMSPFP